MGVVNERTPDKRQIAFVAESVAVLQKILGRTLLRAWYWC
jgi:hypothetical protein